MSISPVSTQASFAAAQPARPAPAKRDNDGDFDNGAKDSRASGAVSGSGRQVDMVA